MYEIACELQGLVPMMFDRFFNPEETETPKTKSKHSWKNDLVRMMYVDRKGVYVPADNIRMMLIGNKFRPGAATILGSYIETKKKTEYLNLVKSCVWVLGPTNPLKVYVQPKRTTYDDYDERTFIGTNGRKIKRRPLVNLPWKLSFIVQVTDDNLTPEKVREFFEVACLRCGVGAYGPTFGRCKITKWQLLKRK